MTYSSLYDPVDFEKYGLTEDVVPQSVLQIAQVVGVHAMMRLCDVYGGDALYIPRLFLKDVKSRNYDIWKLAQTGVPTKDIAEKYGITSRAVLLVLKKEARRPKDDLGKVLPREIL